MNRWLLDRSPLDFFGGGVPDAFFWPPWEVSKRNAPTNRKNRVPH